MGYLHVLNLVGMYTSTAHASSTKFSIRRIVPGTRSSTAIRKRTYTDILNTRMQSIHGHTKYTHDPGYGRTLKYIHMYPGAGCTHCLCLNRPAPGRHPKKFVFENSGGRMY